MVTSTFSKKNYAKAFRIVRAAFGQSQAELAAKMGLSPSQLSLIEAGRRQPSLRVVESLAEAVTIPSALVTLLASSREELGKQAGGTTAALAAVLLDLLVAASGKDGEQFEDETTAVHQ